MNIESAVSEIGCGVFVTVDGIKINLGSKRTFLDLGWVFVMPADFTETHAIKAEARQWIAKNCMHLPPLPDGRLDMPEFSHNPILVELAQRDWHGEVPPGPMAIPTEAEAVAALKRRGVPKFLDGRPARIKDGRFEPVP